VWRSGSNPGRHLHHFRSNGTINLYLSTVMDAGFCVERRGQGIKNSKAAGFNNPAGRAHQAQWTCWSLRMLSTSPFRTQHNVAGLKAEYMSTVVAPIEERGVSCSLDHYLVLPDHTMDARIAAARRELGSRAVILGHHYQRDEVIRFADFRGDSYKLAQEA